MITNIYRYINKHFDFLQDFGFSKNEFCGGEYQLCFKSNFIKFNILYYKGINRELKKRDCIDIILEYDGQRHNLLQCPIIKPNSLNELRNLVFDKKIIEQIQIYAKFIKDNINLFL